MVDKSTRLESADLPRAVISLIDMVSASHYWLWCPILATILGAQFGTFLYDTFLLTSDESIATKL